MKKCGSTKHESCLRLNGQDCGRLTNLPGPMPVDDHHYKEFPAVLGARTNESAMPSLKTQRLRCKDFIPCSQTSCYKYKFIIKINHSLLHYFCSADLSKSFLN